MKKYELNGLGEGWIWEAENEELATIAFLKSFGASDHDDFERYCESIGIMTRFEWTELA